MQNYAIYGCSPRVCICMHCIFLYICMQAVVMGCVCQSWIKKLLTYLRQLCNLLAVGLLQRYINIAVVNVRCFMRSMTMQSLKLHSDSLTCRGVTKHSLPVCCVVSFPQIEITLLLTLQWRSRDGISCVYDRVRVGMRTLRCTSWGWGHSFMLCIIVLERRGLALSHCRCSYYYCSYWMVWSTGKSVSLDCITGQSERSRADFRDFQASFEDLLLHVILDVSHVQRIRDLLVMRYINVRFTYLLTYSECPTLHTGPTGSSHDPIRSTFPQNSVTRDTSHTCVSYK